MIHHLDIGTDETSRSRELRRLIANGEIRFGGYRPGKIYGRLRCVAGKRMKLENRVFFKDEEEAIAAGYRPCARCMAEKYRAWRGG